MILYQFHTFVSFLSLLMRLTCIGIHKTKNSDEYVFAGGTRQSDVIAQQKETRENKKKAKGKEEEDKTDSAQ